MFADKPRKKAAARKVAKFFASHNNFLTHSRRVGIDQMLRLGVTVQDLRQDVALRDLVKKLYSAIIMAFDMSGAFKLIENSVGDAYIRMIQVPQLAMRAPAAPTAAQPPRSAMM
jgi:hypothetical protein